MTDGIGYTFTPAAKPGEKAKLVIDGQHLQLKGQGALPAQGLHLSSNGKTLQISVASFRGNTPDTFSSPRVSRGGESIDLSKIGAGLEITGPVVLGDFRAPKGENAKQIGLSVSGVPAVAQDDAKGIAAQAAGNETVVIAGRLENFDQNPVSINLGEGDDNVVITGSARTQVRDSEGAILGKDKEPRTVKIDLGEGDNDTIVTQGTSKYFKAQMAGIENIN